VNLPTKKGGDCESPADASEMGRGGEACPCCLCQFGAQTAQKATSARENMQGRFGSPLRFVVSEGGDCESPNEKGGRL
jgi:hypothetical protein